MWRRFYLESGAITAEVPEGNPEWPNHKDRHQMWANDKIVLPAFTTLRRRTGRRSLCLKRSCAPVLSTTNTNAPAKQCRGRESPTR